MKRVFFIIILITGVHCRAMQSPVVEKSQETTSNGENRTPTPINTKKKYGPTRIQSVEKDTLVEAYGFKPSNTRQKVKTKKPELHA